MILYIVNVNTLAIHIMREIAPPSYLATGSRASFYLVVPHPTIVDCLRRVTNPRVTTQ